MHDEKYERLIACFRQVFPNMKPSDISLATQETVAAWDSIAHVTLLSLIGEKLGVDIDFEEFAEATSFAAILELVRASAV